MRKKKAFCIANKKDEPLLIPPSQTLSPSPCKGGTEPQTTPLAAMDRAISLLRYPFCDS